MGFQGEIKKLKTQYESIVQYYIPNKENDFALNPLIGKKIKLSFSGNKFCKATGQKIKNTYGQGYSWEAFITLPECDTCIFKPELCHYANGTCRDPKWGEDHCFKPHIIYLSLTSDLKIGITRKTQIPTRWIDQGASKAIQICEVSDRLTSGKIEVEIAKELQDKTNWIKMLKNESVEVDLVKEKKKITRKYENLLKSRDAKILGNEVFEINYPVEKYPTKVKQYNLDKKATIEEVLMGIKGQYLIFENGVLNMRKHQGYEISIN